MKRKLVWMLWVAAVLGLVLTGCGQQRTQASYIGADAAKAIALDAAGIAEGAATFASADLENRNGTDYYQVTFTADGKNYAYDIDAVTGVVISGTQNGGTGGGADASGTETAAVGEGKAKEIALNHAGLTEDQVTFVRSRLDWEDGRQVYDVEFYTSDYKEYDYEIDARTGEILSFDYDAEYYNYTQPSNNTGTYIGEAKARSIALSYVSGATDANVRYARLDWDDGRAEYEVKIYYGTMEYEFEIDAYSGAIISRDVESIYD